MLAPTGQCHAGEVANGGPRPIVTNRSVGPQTKDAIVSLCCVPALGRPASFGCPIPDSIGAVVVTNACRYPHLLDRLSCCMDAAFTGLIHDVT